MKEQLISLETAKLAKEKGFDVPCTKHYSSNKNETGGYDIHRSRQYVTHKSLRSGGYLAPTQSLLQKWLRDKHRLYLTVDVAVYGDEGRYAAQLVGYHKLKFTNVLIDGFTIYNTYEEALEEGLQQALKLIK